MSMSHRGPRQIDMNYYQRCYRLVSECECGGKKNKNDHTLRTDAAGKTDAAEGASKVPVRLADSGGAGPPAGVQTCEISPQAGSWMSDAELLDWVEAYDADINCLRSGPQGDTHRPWTVCTGVSPDGRGRTVREAIQDMITKLMKLIAPATVSTDAAQHVSKPKESGV